MAKRCKDCELEGITSRRKAPYPGPRCSTHHRARKFKAKTRTREQRWKEVYGLTAEQYWKLYEFQGGKCNICRRAQGKRKALSVDHCHATGVVRQLLCNPCNVHVLGHLRDDPDALQRAKDSLILPPAVQLFGEIVAPVFYADGE